MAYLDKKNFFDTLKLRDEHDKDGKITVKIGIIGAMSVEVKALVEAMEGIVKDTISQIDFYEGKLDGFEVVIAACGPGKVNAAICTQAMIMRYAPDCVINTGVAGSLSQVLSVGDYAIATTTVQYDMDTTAIGDPLGFVSGVSRIEFPCDEKIIHTLSAIAAEQQQKTATGCIATGDVFLTDRVRKNQIVTTFEAIACDMESASIGHVCYVNAMPYGILRSISDNANDDSHMDYATFLSLAAENAANVVKLFVRHMNEL